MKKINNYLILPVVLVLALAQFTPVSAGDSDGKNERDKVFVTQLSGDSEVNKKDTDARGTMKMRFRDNEDRMEFALEVENIRDVKAAHLHLGKAGMNGPVIAWVFPSSPPERLIVGEFDGVLGRGDIRSGDLVGPMSGKSLEDLANEIKNGNVFVNVHTNNNPDGEIRGQLMFSKDTKF